MDRHGWLRLCRRLPAAKSWHAGSIGSCSASLARQPSPLLLLPHLRQRLREQLGGGAAQAAAATAAAHHALAPAEVSLPAAGRRGRKVRLEQHCSNQTAARFEQRRGGKPQVPVWPHQPHLPPRPLTT